ncbi:MAG: flagellar hook-basal body complex protein [Rhodobacteraceae bacterium]|nr:flagellar hook-basal body complex protein [Paracoccaceae bacterium]
MDNATYATLTRQSGLQNEMQVLANNIANVSTDGYQKEGLVFSEFVSKLEDADSSLSMAAARARVLDRTQGQLTQTGGQFDFAIEGDGYFMVATPQGNRLTRAGHFFPDSQGNLSAADGAQLLDAGQAPIFIPPDAVTVHLASDGTLSADGRLLGQVGIFVPNDVTQMTRAGDVRFSVESGGTKAVEEPSLAQGFVEASNVDPVLEVARMIEVQRAYESGRSLLDHENDRIRNVIEILGR